MKRVIAFLTVIVTVFSSCKKTPVNTSVYGCTDYLADNYNASANINDGSCKYTGKAVFWYNKGGSNATVVVNVGGVMQTAYINGGYYYTGVPSCGADYCANFTLPSGSYPYAASAGALRWSGTVVVPKNGCVRVLLPH